ncbi:hypothetical protein F3K50_06135 [Pseudomonas marginalis]|nr:hypothetical protein F3K50_06135 [Pseudomonas marginalis]
MAIKKQLFDGTSGSRLIAAEVSGPHRNSKAAGDPPGTHFKVRSYALTRDGKAIEESEEKSKVKHADLEEAKDAGLAAATLWCETH